MPNIDELSIELTASTKQAEDKIDKLIGSLSRLQSSLNINFGDNLTRSLDNLSGSLTNLGASINGVDAKKISSISRALGSLSTNASKLGNLSQVKVNTEGLDRVADEDVFGRIAEGITTLQMASSGDFSGIRILSSAIGKLNGENITSAAEAMPKIAQGIQSLDGINIPTLEGLSSLASSLRQLGSKTIRGAGEALPSIAKALHSMSALDMGGLQALGENSESIAEFGRAVAVMGRKSVASAVENMPKLTEAFYQLTQRLASAPTVSDNTIRLAEAMAKLSQNSQRAGNSVHHAHRKLKLFNHTATKSHKATTSLAAAIGKIYATYWLLFRLFSKIRQAINIASDLTEVQNVVDTVFGDARDKVQDFADSAIMAFGMSELSAKEFSSRFQSMGVAMGVTDKQVASANEFLGKVLDDTKRKVEGVEDAYKDLGNTTADMSINLTKLAADMGSFYNKEYAEVAEDLQAVMTGMVKPLRKYGLDLTNATLQQWAMANGMNYNMKTMSQAEKTMLRYQYVMANMGHVMNDYAITADTWANVTRTIGEQFKKLGQIIGQGLVNTFKPALIKFRDFLNGLIGLVEKTLNAVGKLLGWQIEITEVGLENSADAAEDIAEGIGDAAGNAKKLNKQLAGFDELNNLTALNDGGGSGSGSGGASGGGAGKAQTSGGGVTFKPYESEIDSWEGLGKAISDKISEELGNIEWDDVYEKAADFGKGLADFMNGMFAGESGKKLFESLGTTIAGAVNTVMTAADTWAKELKWDEIGKNIKDGLVSFLENWKPKLTADAVGGIASGIATAVYSAVSDITAWAKLGDKIGEGIDELIKNLAKPDKQGNSFWDNFFGSFTSIANGISAAVYRAVTKVENWSDLGKSIAKGIKKALKGENGWNAKLTGKAIGKLANAIADVLYPIVSDQENWSALATKIAEGINEFLLTVEWEKVGVDLTEALQGIATLIAETINKINWLEVAKAVLKGIKGALKSLANDPEGTSNLLQAAAIVLGFTAGKSIITNMLSANGLSKGIASVAGSGANGALNNTIGQALAKATGGTYKNGMLSSNLFWTLGLTIHFSEGFEQLKKHKELQEEGGGLIDMATAEGQRQYDKRMSPFERFWNDAVDLMKSVIKKRPMSATVALELPKGEVKSLVGKAQKALSKHPLTTHVEDGTTDKQMTKVWDNVNKRWISTTKNKALDVNAKSTTTQKDTDEWWIGMTNNWKNGQKKSLGVEAHNTTTADDTYTWWDSIKGMWVTGTKDEYLKVKAGITKKQAKSDAGDVWKTVKDEFGNEKKLYVGVKGHNINKDVNGKKTDSVWSETQNAWGEKWLEVGVKPDATSKQTFVTKVQEWFRGMSVNVALATTQASGGAFFGGRWHEIAQYASGGLPDHGSMFVAGEAGAEVVGHVGGRTEVLNQSQLASTMYAAVSDAMAQQNAILLKQNEYLSGILAKDYGITSGDIFNATRREATNYYNRTGRPAFQG